MNYIIPESRLYGLIFDFLNMKNFIRLKRNETIFFVNFKKDKTSVIMYHIKDGGCYLNLNLVKQISNFFSLDPKESRQVISMWVENVLQMKCNYSVLVDN